MDTGKVKAGCCARRGGRASRATDSESQTGDEQVSRTASTQSVSRRPTAILQTVAQGLAVAGAVAPVSPFSGAQILAASASGGSGSASGNMSGKASGLTVSQFSGSGKTSAGHLQSGSLHGQRSAPGEIQPVTVAAESGRQAGPIFRAGHPAPLPSSSQEPHESSRADSAPVVGRMGGRLNFSQRNIFGKNKSSGSDKVESTRASSEPVLNRLRPKSSRSQRGSGFTTPALRNPTNVQTLRIQSDEMASAQRMAFMGAGPMGGAYGGSILCPPSPGL